ncbi:hypothetical protein [uncultured Sphaerochaeta sp.]|uniref:hypothetical protein n=1 Tax=uncultured Sphaerochaeta sp. TaxID=886478 RepID=UPI0037499AF1
MHYYQNHAILGNVHAVGQVLGTLLEELKEKHACVGDVRYIGLFSALELVKGQENQGSSGSVWPGSRGYHEIHNRAFGQERLYDLFP